MAIKRVAVVYDNTDRPETTGVYIQRAIESMTGLEVRHFLPRQLFLMAFEPFDLYLQVDDGLGMRLPEQCRPAVWWAIDTHMDLARYVEGAPRYDHVFTAQRDGAEELKRHGISHVSWLPLACDPAVHRRHDVAKAHDLCFIGNLVLGHRSELVHLLQRHFPDMLVDRRYFDEMAQAYSASRIVFNRSIKNDVNMRVFEATACGSLLLTNDLTENGQAELFQDGVHFATYRDADEMLDKVRYYLKHKIIRERIAKAGMAEALAKHTYSHRVQTMLERAKEFASRIIVPVTAPPVQPTAKVPEPNAGADPFYFDLLRPEVLTLVPTNARRVLDVGCGAGRLGEALRERQGASTVGIELNPVAAARARTRLKAVHELDADTVAADYFAPGGFDAVVCADVLEHLRDPQVFLRKVHQWLRPRGALVVSVPNVRHHSVVRGLLEGHWTYEPAGLLDATHLRFFTRRELEKLLFRAGFAVKENQAVPGAEYEQWLAEGRPGEGRLGRLHVGGLAPEEAEEFHVYQYLVSAAAQPPQDRGMTSIILVTHNGVDDTRRCLASLRHTTDEPFELVCIDNCSSDGTPDFLESWGVAHVVRNGENRGFPAAVNQGLALAKGRQILLLNNDTVLTTGWLVRLLDGLYARDDVGLVGPVSNCAPGEQRVSDAPYGPDLIGLDGYAWDRARVFENHFHEVGALSGFCLLFRRDVFEQIGAFDERFGIGTCEDDDYCLRARKAGWKILVAPGAYVHHSGHRTFQALGMDFDALAAKNARTLEEKWRAAEIVVPAESTESKRAEAPSGITSIILVTHGQLAFTQACIESIRRYTPEPFELLVVDNASTDDTLTWLRSQPDVKVIANEINRGFPAAANQGLAAARGDDLLILNNDTVVTPGWLTRLRNALHADENLGLVGPCSNRVSGEQEIPVSYDQASLEGLNSFAATLAERRRGELLETDRLVGFCLLLKREVYDKVGGFDERFGIGNFEDDDLCRRAVQAGFRLAVVRDAFVHHHGHATFRAAGVDLNALLHQNQGLYQEKWAARAPKAARTLKFRIAPGEGPELSLERIPGEDDTATDGEVMLSLCMIVRDNARTLRATLESIKPYVDEVIVVDTGSKDETPDIAKEFGARLFHFPWIDDFSAARNESFRHARGKWLFWMDSDDVISPECGSRLRELVYGPHPGEVLGYFMQVHCPGPGSDGYLNVTAVDHLKLVRNRPDLRFEHRIHEQLLASVHRAGGEVVWTDIHVTHAGYDHSPEGQKRKLERDLRILHLEEKEKPDHPFTLFNLGMTYADTDQPLKGADYLEHSIAASGQHDSTLRKAYALLVKAHEKAKNLASAEAACLRGLGRFPLDTELRFQRGRLLHDTGHPAEAVAVYRDLLARPDEIHLKSVDTGLTGYMTRQNLAACFDDLGDLTAAEEQLRRITADVPDYRAGWRGLAQCLIKQGRAGEVVPLAQRLASRSALPGEAELLMGHAALSVGDWEGGKQWHLQAAERMPEDPEPLDALSRYCFERDTPLLAEPFLRRLLAVNPKNAAAWHNLGCVHLERGHAAEAIEALRRSLELRPEADQTRAILEKALKASGVSGCSTPKGTSRGKLSELFTRQGSDKCTDHAYGAFYDRLAEELLRSQKDLRILEFGVQYGASIRALSEYFGQRAIVYGVDLDVGTIAALGERVRGIVANQTKEGDLAKLAAKLREESVQLDLVIDDCTHRPEDQLRCAEALWPLLAPGGTYVIEDVQRPETAERFRHFPGFQTIDLRHIRGQSDDFLVVLKRPLS